MELFWILFMAGIACISTSVQADDSETDKDELITSLLKENEDMKLRLSEIAISLKEICKTLAMDTKEESNTLTGAYKKPVVGNASERVDNRDYSDDIKVISIESHGVVNDSLRLTLEFETSSNYTLDWHQLFNIANGLFWTDGKVTRTKIGDERYLYKCNVEFHDIKLTYNINARIHNMKYSVTFDFNMTAIAREGKEVFKDVEYQITEFSPIMTLPENSKGNFTFVVRVKNNTKISGNSTFEIGENDILGSKNQISVHYTWVNTTSDTNTVENLVGTTEVDISSNILSNDTFEYHITLKEEYVMNGGLFQFSLGQPVFHYRYIDSLSYGVFMELVHKDIMSYIPPQVLVLYNDGQTMYKVSSRVSIFCLAMGNPRPTVKVFRKRNGRMKEMRTKELTPDAVTSLKYITVENTTEKGSKFICKASNGNLTQESESKVELYKDVTFDDKKTGVMKNSSKRVVVSCKAFGNPMPNLEMRLGSLSGPDLMKTEGNFTKGNHTKSTSVRVKIVFSPPDFRFDVIYCVAIQSEFLFNVMVNRKILVHPYTYQTVDSSERFRFYQSL